MKTAAVAVAPPLAETERARRPFVAKVNPNYQKLPGSYLFSEIARRTAEREMERAMKERLRR